MTFFLQYLFKLSVSLAVVYLLYQLLFRRLTFYNHNRWYLLGYTFLSFLIPFIDISPVLQRNDWSETSIVNWVPVLDTLNNNITSETNKTLSPWQFMLIILITGMVVMSTRLLIQFLSFRKMRRKAVALDASSLKIYQVNEQIIPFSFGNSIFINRHLHSETELQEIIRHEFVHVKQRHSIDIIWAEVICLFNWYNPFAWLLKKAIRQNLEFIADNKVLQNGINKKEYQYLLLKVIGNHQYSIATAFNFSSLKKRIAMMNKLRSARVNLLRFLFILPLLAVILVSFREQIGDSLKVGRHSTNPVFTDTIPDVRHLNSKGYYIDVKDKKGECELVIRDENRKEVKRLLLTEWNKNKSHYEGLYGEILPPPPPLPPGSLPVTAPPAPAAESLPPAMPAAPLPPVPPKDSKLTRVSDDFEITTDKARITLRNGKTEHYDLTDPRQKKDFESKYGRIITVATPADLTAPVVALGSGEGLTTTTIAPTTLAVVSADLSTTTIAPAKVNGSLASTKPLAALAPNIIGGVAVIDDRDYQIHGTEDIIVKITKHTTRKELDGFIQQMKAKDIVLTYDEIEYNDKGQLVVLTGTMASSDGSKSRFVASDFEMLILAMIKKSDRTYFKVSTRDQKEVI
jgi:beta-lactamase regulating signal transducer with metallopeptidase domain